MTTPNSERSSPAGPKKKIFNDPVYGLISFPNPFLYELIDHPWVQRLRRIRQLGFTDFVYSGASHSRFNHALGALHLMETAIRTLRWKGVAITEEEEEGAEIAILLHDIGHGPYSHALERMILPMEHEQLSLRVMQALNRQYDGRLDTAIAIFSGDYPKRFLHQLVSGQLDMDRMDYLNRDSFYTGVVEGMIGYDRIIKMLNVLEGKLVVEEKGALSVEQFLMARRMMYWQVYLHKTVLAVEQMMKNLFLLVRESGAWKNIPGLSPSLTGLMQTYSQTDPNGDLPDGTLEKFLALDDPDLIQLIKAMSREDHTAGSLLAKGILDRRIFRIRLTDEALPQQEVSRIRQSVLDQLSMDSRDGDYLFIRGMETNAAYHRHLGDIDILMKDGRVKPITHIKGLMINQEITEKYFYVFPRI